MPVRSTPSKMPCSCLALFTFYALLCVQDGSLTKTEQLIEHAAMAEASAPTLSTLPLQSPSPRPASAVLLTPTAPQLASALLTPRAESQSQAQTTPASPAPTLAFALSPAIAPEPFFSPSSTPRPPAAASLSVHVGAEGAEGPTGAEFHASLSEQHAAIQVCGLRQYVHATRTYHLACSLPIPKRSYSHHPPTWHRDKSMVLCPDHFT